MSQRSEIGARVKLLLQANHIEGALALVQSELVNDVGNPLLLKLARTAALRAGRTEESLRFAQRLAESVPDDRKNCAQLVNLLIRCDRAAEALRTLEAVDDHLSDGPHSYILKARALLALDRADEALSLLRAGASIYQDATKLLSLARNVALKQRAVEDSIDFAVRLTQIVPDDEGNRAALSRLYFGSGDFPRALEHAEALVQIAPKDVNWNLLKARCLAALNRTGEAIHTLENAVAGHPHDATLLSAAHSIALQQGRLAEARRFAIDLVKVAPQDVEHRVALAEAFLASGDDDAAGQQLDAVQCDNVSLAKAKAYLAKYKQLRSTAPQLVAAWHAAMNNQKPAAVKDVPKTQLRATMIQYWSQGELPSDVAFVLSTWRDLLEREGLGTVQLFTRASAEDWLSEHAPEFCELFSNAYHYAMESDIFRIAFASREPCIYVDVDGWPIENTAQIVRFALESKRSMLYFRANQPWIVNGFFVSRPDCPFFKELVAQALAVKLTGLPKDHNTIEFAFGPARYNRVLTDLLARQKEATVSVVEDIPGCSALALENASVLFTHEAAAASVRPPFRLAYKLTDDYWKKFRSDRNR